MKRAEKKTHTDKTSRMLDWKPVIARLKGAYSESTIRAYNADVEKYVNWCEDVRSVPFPASLKLLSKFISNEAASCSASTIKRRLAAIGKIHRLMRLDNPVTDEEVKLALRRAFRGKFSRPKQARGLTSKLRDQLIEACSEDCLTCKRDKALIAVGYDTLARRSELSSLSLEDINFNDAGAKLLIKRSKNDQYGYGRVAHLSKRSTNLLKDWIRNSRISEGYVFRLVKNDFVGSNALHPHSIGRIIKRAAEKAGLSEDEVRSLSGHSMRIGAAQDMMIAGFDILPIMAAGGWKTTNVVARYIENAELSPILQEFLNRS